MGMLSYADLLSESLELSGDTSLQPRAIAWLNAALVNLYTSAAWPFLIDRYGPFEIPVGYQALDAFGNGEGTENGIFTIHKVFVGNMQGGKRRELGVKQVLNMTADDEEMLNPPDQRGGTATELIMSGSGQPFRWNLSLNRMTAEPFRMVYVAQAVPPSFTVAQINDFPAYPNDETIIQCIKAKALFHQGDERWTIEEDRLQQMVRQDRVVHLNSVNNGVMPLKKWR